MNTSNIQYGASSFSEIRRLNALYVDKTERIYDLICSTSRRLFLSRPRRFGKTLLIDMLEEIFSGNKELFSGLAIYDKDYDWEIYPVIRINLSDCDAVSSGELKEYLCELVEKIASNKFGFDITNIKTRTPRSCLSALFECFQKRNQKVVVLIDEYDYPVISNMDSLKTADSLRKVLKNFYAVLKANTNSIHFEFLTGVTKLAYTTIFSGVNDVNDISSHEDFADILGYRQDELEKYFSVLIDRYCNENKISRQNFLDEIKEWYDGYRFSKKDVTVYNPSSINKFFYNKCEFDVYWISTGTPEFIVKLLRKNSSFNIEEEFLKNRINFFSTNTLSLSSIDSTNIMYLLYQTGYVTVVGINEKGRYRLGYPNEEVCVSFSQYLAQVCLGLDLESKFNADSSIADRLSEGNIELFVEATNNFFTSLPYSPQKYVENTFQVGLIASFRTAGLKVRSEVLGYKGRSDIDVITQDRIYIIEIKIANKAQKGMDQIKEKEYYISYLNDKNYDGRGITIVSLAFDSKTHELKDYMFEDIR